MREITYKGFVITYNLSGFITCFSPKFGTLRAMDLKGIKALINKEISKK